MKYVICILLLVFFAPSSFAKKKDPVSKTYSGYLMDKMCAKRKAGDMEKMKNHSKTCLTEEECASSGYGVVVGKKFIPFDAKGNDMTVTYLKTLQKEKDIQVDVKGSMKKNKLAVTGIADHS
jgi:hypothetical protein